MTVYDLFEGLTIYLNEKDFKQFLYKMDVPAALSAEYERLGSMFVSVPRDCYYCEHNSTRGFYVRKIKDA